MGKYYVNYSSPGKPYVKKIDPSENIRPPGNFYKGVAVKISVVITLGAEQYLVGWGSLMGEWPAKQ